jgi:hypothetical protein
MRNQQWVFGIAQLAFRLEGPEDWLSPMQKAWHTWEAKEEAQPWILNIQVDHNMDPPTEPLFNAKPECRGGVCTLDAPGLQVRIDAQKGYGEMTAHPAAAAADVVYFLRVAIALSAFVHQSMLFHAACVVHRDKGYLLFGLSGSGKTTASQLSKPDPVLNDDLLLLCPSAKGWLVYSTPFGKRRGDLMVTSLQAALRLVQDREVFLEPLSKGRALTELVANTPIVSSDRLLLPELLERWSDFIDQVPVRALHFRKDPTFWEVVDAEWE